MTRAQVVAAFGRRFLVEGENRQLLECVRRGKKTDVACGDRVEVELTSPGEGVIESIEPRQSLLYRADAFKMKMLAANLDQVFLVLAWSPPFSPELLMRALVACEAAHIQPFILRNKEDLPAGPDHLQECLVYLEQLGYPVFSMSAKAGVENLRPLLQGHSSLLMGQSGMGKSTLINALVPGADARTNEISMALNSGKHTTTHTRVYYLDEQSQILDSPGLQEFGLNHLDPEVIEDCFPEFRPLRGECRFQDCRHREEPGCVFKTFAQGSPWRQLRLELLIQLQDTSRRARFSASA
jgi:ribosome biogenesis GTPase